MAAKHKAKVSARKAPPSRIVTAGRGTASGPARCPECGQPVGTPHLSRCGLAPPRRSARGARIHLDRPSIRVSDQSQGFDGLLVRLYELEDGLSPVGHYSKVFAEARAICEVFLPPFRVQSLRREYDEE